VWRISVLTTSKDALPQLARPTLLTVITARYFLTGGRESGMLSVNQRPSFWAR
jgi:hypothetical protein